MNPTLGDPPALDDGDVIDRLDAGLPPASAEEAAARAPYERLFAMIRDLEDPPPPAGWEDRLDAHWAQFRARRRRRIRIAIGAAAAIAVAALLAWLS